MAEGKARGRDNEDKEFQEETSHSMIIRSLNCVSKWIINYAKRIKSKDTQMSHT